MQAVEQLGAAVDAVVSADLSSLSFEQLQEQFTAMSPLSQRLAGFGDAVLAELQARGGGQIPTGDGKARSLAGWAADATGDTASAAGRRIRLASLLRQGLPAVAQAVLHGTVGLKQAEVLTALIGRISPAALLECEPSLIVAAQRMDPAQLRSWVAHQRATWVEPAVDHDEASAAARRYLKTRQENDGSLWGSFRLARGDSESLLTALEPLARKQGSDDTRSAAQRRADALVELCEQVLRHGELPDTGGQRAQLAYVLPADWAARQAEQHTCPHCQPCERHTPISFTDLVAAGVPSTQAGTAATTADGRPVVPAEHACAVAAWTGPQTRTRIETMLCDARLSRVLLDSLGQVKGLEALTDSITPAQRRALAARDLGCAVIGCTRPPAMCDAHHLQARADGGPTTLANMVLLCRRHHVLWHLGELTLYDLHVPWLADPYPDRHPPPTPRTAEPKDELRRIFS